MYILKPENRNTEVMRGGFPTNNTNFYLLKLKTCTALGNCVDVSMIQHQVFAIQHVLLQKIPRAIESRRTTSSSNNPLHFTLAMEKRENEHRNTLVCYL